LHAVGGEGLQAAAKLRIVTGIPRRVSDRIPTAMRSVVAGLVDDLRATLGTDLVGMYLYGSAMTGGFEPDSSDLDIVIVTEPAAGAIDLARLEAVHRRLAEREPDWADRLDLAYVGRGTLAAFREGGSVASISHDEPLQLYDEADDWLQTWYLVREAGLAIVGPPAASLIEPIAVDDFLNAVGRSALELAARAAREEHDGWRAYALLTLCRVLVTSGDGTIVTKADAGRAAVRADPSLEAAVSAALAFRKARGRVPLTPEDRAAVLAAIETLAADVRSRFGAPSGGARRSPG
jgi:predicted nucleotidyltransferase